MPTIPMLMGIKILVALPVVFAMLIFMQTDLRNGCKNVFLKILLRHIKGAPMSKILTIADIAAHYGVSDDCIRKRALRREVGKKHGRRFIFTPADLEALAPWKVGRPKGEKEGA